MEFYQQIIQAIYDAISEVNLSLQAGQMLEGAPETVLLGDGKLDSLQFLNLTVAVEENIERMFKQTISVTDAALLGDETEPLTVAALAHRIQSLIGSASHSGVGALS